MGASYSMWFFFFNLFVPSIWNLSRLESQYLGTVPFPPPSKAILEFSIFSDDFPNSEKSDRFSLGCALSSITGSQVVQW